MGDHQVSLPAGTQVQVLNKGDVTSVVSFQLAGAPVITQIPSDQLVFLAAAAPKRGTPASATASPHAGATLSGSSPSISVIPVSEAPSSPMTVPNDQQQEDADEPLPDFKTTLSPSDIELPAVQFTALNGSFYVVINGAPVSVVYSLPMDKDRLAPSASNLIFYGPYPDEHTDLQGNIVPDLVTKLGCSVFSFSFKADHDDLSGPTTAYWSKESGWFKAAMDAREEIVKGFGLKKEKLFLMGYSGGGAWC